MTSTTPETPYTASQADPTDSSAMSSSEKKTIQLVYFLQALGFVFGLTFIAAAIINYVKRADMTSDSAKLVTLLSAAFELADFGLARPLPATGSFCSAASSCAAIADETFLDRLSWSKSEILPIRTNNPSQ